MFVEATGKPHPKVQQPEKSKVAAFRYDSQQLEVDLKRTLERLSWRSSIKSDTRIFVKPNFTLPFSKPGVTTSENLVEATLGVLKDRASEVFIGESDGGSGSFSAEYSLKNHGVEEICQRTGATILNLSNLERIRIEDKVNGRNVKVTLPRPLLEMDATISLPVLKVHVVTKVSLSLKNVWGCHPDPLRLMDHTLLSERLVVIAKAIHLKYAVIDGIFGLDRKGPMDGKVVNVGVVLVGDNPVATDSTAARLMGFRPEKIRHITVASAAGLGPHLASAIEVLDDLSQYQQHFTLKPSVIDRLASLTFRSDIVTKLVFDSPFSRIVFALLGREYRKKIVVAGDELSHGGRW